MDRDRDPLLFVGVAFSYFGRLGKDAPTKKKETKNKKTAGEQRDDICIPYIYICTYIHTYTWRDTISSFTPSCPFFEFWSAED